MKSIFCSILLSSFIFHTISLKALIIHVPDDQSTIQQAIAIANNADTILVAPGTYFENIDYRGKSVFLLSHFALTGEFDDIVKTIIDGSNSANPDTASCVVFYSGESSLATLQGFTLTGGTGTKWIDPQFPDYTWRSGGGILIFQSSPTIKNNIIVDNHVTDQTGADGAQGGGICIYGGNSLIQNNIIKENEALYGAGIVIDYSGAKVKNNIIKANYGGSTYGGGGIWVLGNSNKDIIIENNTIVDNESIGSGTYGGKGGALFVWQSTITARNNIIWGNTQSQGGPIAEISGEAIISYSNVEGGFDGAGNINSDPVFMDTLFVLDSPSPCIDSGDSTEIYNDAEDPENPGNPIWPGSGTLRNDMGVYGGHRNILLNYAYEPVDTTDTTNIFIPEKKQHGYYPLKIYPNPVKSHTNIHYSLFEPGLVKLSIYDIQGQMINTLVDKYHTNGKFDVQWNKTNTLGTKVKPGIYQCIVSVNKDKFGSTKFVVL